MTNFLVKEYLISHKLANEDGDPIVSETIPANPAWGLGPFTIWETMIYLCTLIHFFEKESILDSVSFYVREDGYHYYSILVDEVPGKYISNYRWDVLTDTVDYLIDHMAGSNVSYLAGELFYRG